MVYVVTYQTYLYGDEYSDIKYVMEGFDVKGVFSTKQKAEDFIKRHLRKEAIGTVGNDRKELKEFIEEYENHYQITVLELDKRSFK